MNIGIIIFAVVILGVLLRGIWEVFKIFQIVYHWWQQNRSERSGPLRKLPPRYLQPIEQYFEYYHHLSDHDKARFQHRVAIFIRSKKFIAREGLSQVTAEMVALISATAVMLTMGLPILTFESFKKILVYPSDYFNTITKAHHKGEVNVGMGIIVLSWEHFVKGFMHGSDGINLGIHEMAHALHLEDRMVNYEHDFLSTSLLAYWRGHALDEMDKIASGHDHLFRPYAATNEEEFFAVAMENFFERPREFRDDLPQLYTILTQLLGQNPAEGTIAGHGTAKDEPLEAS